MKYWFFNGNDVVGPFTPKELAAEKAFNENSLVCPEAFSDEEDHWKPALSFTDFQALLSKDSESQDLSLEQEMDTLLKEKSPLSFEKTNTDNSGLQLPKKPAKPGPIEEYFNHIEKEDLGDILGIPDPAENSDMDLAHALEHQLAKTSSTRRKAREQGLTPTDEQTAAQLEPVTELPAAQQTHHVATATEVFATKAPVALSEPEATKTDLPLLPANDFQGMPTADTAPVPQHEPPTVSAPLYNSASQVQQAIMDAQPKELLTAPPTQAPAVASQQPSDPQATYTPQGEVASLRTERLEVNSINARLKQTQEMKDFVQAHAKPISRPHFWERKSVIFLVAIGAIFGTLFALRQLQARPVESAVSQKATAATSTAQELLSEQPASQPAPAVTPAPVDKRTLALSVVQNHKLSGGRGTLGNYLNQIYHTQLSQGYTADWEAQPLHKNIYIVKYRLTKTRKEPIIYIFQADVSQGKLTGALNNISLDLVGKI